MGTAGRPRKTTKSTQRDVKTRLFKIQESDSGSIATDNDDVNGHSNARENYRYRNDDILGEDIVEESESDIEQMQSRDTTT